MIKEAVTPDSILNETEVDVTEAQGVLKKKPKVAKKVSKRVSKDIRKPSPSDGGAVRKVSGSSSLELKSLKTLKTASKSKSAKEAKGKTSSSKRKTSAAKKTPQKVEKKLSVKKSKPSNIKKTTEKGTTKKTAQGKGKRTTKNVLENKSPEFDSLKPVQDLSPHHRLILYVLRDLGEKERVSYNKIASLTGFSRSVLRKVINGQKSGSLVSLGYVDVVQFEGDNSMFVQPFKFGINEKGLRLLASIK